MVVSHKNIPLKTDRIIETIKSPKSASGEFCPVHIFPWVGNLKIYCPRAVILCLCCGVEKHHAVVFWKWGGESSVTERRAQRLWRDINVDKLSQALRDGASNTWKAETYWEPVQVLFLRRDLAYYTLWDLRMSLAAVLYLLGVV